MIPVAIRFTAFGPYVGEQEVRFDRFFDAGLVLIHGETGAGKTVLLDAITYALYGRSSGGGRGDLAAMRCLSAPPDARTAVEYDFEARGRRYRFRRELRARKKRDGSYEYLPERSAGELDENGVLQPFFENPKARDLDRKAQELIGLSCEQLCQVMILPQGQFERLLVAKSEEKEAVLVSLFHAQRWQLIAERICQRANALRQELETGKTEIKTALGGFGCDGLDALGALADETSARLEEQARRRGALSEALAGQRGLLEAEGRLAALFEKRGALERELDALAKQEPEREKKRGRLAQARLAQALLPRLERAKALRAGHESRLAALRAGRAELEAAEGALKRARQARDEVASRAGQAREAQEELARLNALAESYRRLDGAQKEEDDAERDRADAERGAESARLRLEGREARRDALSRERAALLESSAEKLPLLRERLAELRRAKESAEKRARALANLRENDRRRDGLLAERDKLSAALERARETHRAARAAYLSGAAALLARQLQDGQPCPVCGSVHHPGAAGNTQAPGVAGAVLDEAARAQEEAQQALFACDRRLAALDAQRPLLEGALEQPEPDAPAYDEAAYDALRADYERALRENERLEPLAAELRAVEAELEPLAAAAREAAERLARAAAQKERATARAQALRAQRAPGITDSAALEARIRALQAEAEGFAERRERAEKAADDAALSEARARAALGHLSGEEARAREERDALDAELREALARAGFADERALCGAALGQEALDALERELANEQARRAAAAAQLEALRAQLTGPPPDLKAREAQVAALETEKAGLDAAWGALAQECERQRASLRALTRKQERLDAKRLVYDRMYAFGRLLRGDNGVSLRRYVLGVMLSSVAAEANRLLRGVHGGRYQLFRSSEGAGRERKVGLDLEVSDAVSGKRRGVASLSGGEKFLVSLALALGLSAVVQAQSGGVRMEAMFIDEGFGSLDPQSINDALEVLASVRGSRRVVGIISHVEALRESVPASIEVVKGRAGSRLIFHF